MQIRKGDTVYVLAGSSKGKTGKVLHIDTKKNRAIVEGINMRKRHQRPTQKSPKGGVVSVEASIHVSNIALYSSTIGGPTRIGTRIMDDGGTKRRVRIDRKSGEEI